MSVYCERQKPVGQSDVLASEIGISGEIDTDTDSSPVTVYVPPSGFKVSTRAVHLFTDSTAGEIETKFSSGKLIAKLYCAVHTMLSLPEIKLDGEIDDSIEISWSSTSPNCKIFYEIRFKLL
ncbi:MAG: hypothetical protein ACTSPB_20500 [Candidatus Thorarchaeota archaeon]